MRGGGDQYKWLGASQWLRRTCSSHGEQEGFGLEGTWRKTIVMIEYKGKVPQKEISIVYV